MVHKRVCVYNIKGKNMEHMMKAGLVILALAMTIMMQIYASSRKSTICGLILPALILIFSLVVLVQNIRMYYAAAKLADNVLLIVSDFAIYNVPTIIFLCIYNYFQRSRLAVMRYDD